MTGIIVACHLSRPQTPQPVLFVPGGPGMSSISPYATLRKAAANKHIDWVMVEHRDVGLSRKDTSGADPKVSDVTLTAAADDLAAALDAEGVAKATVYGASYGTFLAQIFAVRHPERVNALVLDSPHA